MFQVFHAIPLCIIYFIYFFCAYMEYSAYIEYTSDIRKCLRMWGFLVGVRKKGQ